MSVSSSGNSEWAQQLRQAMSVSTSLAQIDVDALDQFMPMLYEELRTMARSTRLKSRPADRFGTTSIVHETYLKLRSSRTIEWVSRAQFIHLAAMAMRSILIDNARRRQRQKREGDAPHVRAEEAILISERRQDELLMLDDALVRLSQDRPRWADVIVCRVFGGMTLEDIAEQQQRSVATIKRDWQAACLWLHDEMGGDPLDL